MSFCPAHHHGIGCTEKNLDDEESLVRCIEEFPRGHKASLQALFSSPVATLENALADVKTSINAGTVVVMHPEALVKAAVEEMWPPLALKRKAVASASRN